MMKPRTKVMLGILAAFLIMVGFAAWKISADHSGKTYYTRLINEGVATGEQYVEDGDHIIVYQYDEPAFDKDGNELQVSFCSFRERALKTGTYLAIVYNKNNGVISYREVELTEIPAKASEKLQQYAD